MFRGDYHMHTYFSDGGGSVIEMAAQAKERGLREIAITDHGFSKVKGGLKRKDFDRYISEIESARSELPILIGVEANITSTRGGIDIKKGDRDKFDILLCGVHVLNRQTALTFLTFWLPNIFWGFLRFTPKFQRKYNTKIAKRVIEHNDIDIWTHPNRYFAVDVVDIARACAVRGTLVELNGKRVSFRPIDFERMCAVGAKFIIGSDAHAVKNVGNFSRVEEFLKNCDYDPKVIINNEKTFTEYKNERNACNDKNGNSTNAQKPEKRKGFFHRKPRDV
jgi:putative hydrolase